MVFPENNKSYGLWAPEMASHGGIQSYMWRLWEMLHAQDSAKNHRIVGITLNDTNNALVEWPNFVRPRPSGASRKKFRFTLKALTHTSRTQVVIVGHVNQSPVAWLARTLGLIEQYVVVLHGIEAWRRLSWTRRIALAAADCVITTTQYTADICSEVNGINPDKFAVVPLCTPPLACSPDPHFKLEGDFPVLFVGRLARTERYKGVDTIMRSVATLSSEGRSVHLHIVGDGDDKCRLQGILEELAPSSDCAVTFHGQLSDAKLQAAYSSAKAFVMPSAKEGFGIVFLEAMRNGVPCIGGDHGGTKEIFVHGTDGYLVKFENTEALTKHLRALIDSPQLAKSIGSAGKQRFYKDYTFEKFAERWRGQLGMTNALIPAQPTEPPD